MLIQANCLLEQLNFAACILAETVTQKFTSRSITHKSVQMENSAWKPRLLMGIARFSRCNFNRLGINVQYCIMFSVMAILLYYKCNYLFKDTYYCVYRQA